MKLGTLLRALTVAWYRHRLAHCGRRLRLGVGTTILEPHLVSIGDDFFAGPRLYISSPSKVVIGNRVMFGPEVMIIGGDHDLCQHRCRF